MSEIKAGYFYTPYIPLTIVRFVKEVNPKRRKGPRRKINNKKFRHIIEEVR